MTSWALEDTQTHTHARAHTHTHTNTQSVDSAAHTHTHARTHAHTHTQGNELGAGEDSRASRRYQACSVQCNDVSIQRNSVSFRPHPAEPGIIFCDGGLFLSLVFTTANNYYYLTN